MLAQPDVEVLRFVCHRIKPKAILWPDSSQASEQTSYAKFDPCRESSRIVEITLTILHRGVKNASGVPMRSLKNSDHCGAGL